MSDSGIGALGPRCSTGTASAAATCRTTRASLWARVIFTGLASAALAAASLAALIPWTRKGLLACHLPLAALLFVCCLGSQVPTCVAWQRFSLSAALDSALDRCIPDHKLCCVHATSRTHKLTSALPGRQVARSVARAWGDPISSPSRRQHPTGTPRRRDPKTPSTPCWGSLFRLASPGLDW